MSLFDFDIVAEDPKTHARAGVFHTAHGDIPTPIFMPVGTKATVKAVLPSTLKELDAKIILANTYHLAMRPGAELIDRMGGLHNFEKWDRPILTDSGGFQVFSHGNNIKLDDDGVTFRTVDYDGAYVKWTPEENMRIAQLLGSDICMQLDVCPPYPCSKDYLLRAVELSSKWAIRCEQAHTRCDQALFGIVQGGMDLDLRLKSLNHMEKFGNFPGYGIGGYSVGESHETMFESLTPLVSNYMPKEKPRYLMGVGNPVSLVRGVGVGLDMFDCVLPTRTARMASAITSVGRINFRNAKYAEDESPIDINCHCPACSAGFSKAYLHHLVKQKEILGSMLLSIHNIFYLLNLMKEARESIISGSYSDFMEDFLNSKAAIKDF